MSLTIDPDYIDFGEVSAPTTPSTGNVRIYAKADGKVYRKDDTGVETELGGSSFTGFTLAGGSGTPQAIASGDTVTITGSNGITTSAGTTDTITISGSAFIQSFTVAGGSGTPQTINNSNTLTFTGAGGVTTSAGATDVITIDGSAFMQSFTVAGGAGSNQTISGGNTLSILGSGGITTTGSATDTITIDGATAGRMQLISSGSMSGVSTLTISSIPSTYRHLRLYVYVRGGNAADDSIALRVGNGGADATAGNYSRNAFILTGVTPSYAGDIGATANLLGSASIGLTGIANRYASLIADFNNYATTTANKVVNYTHGVSFGATAAEQKYITGRGHWLSNSAIDTISVVSLLTSNFAAESVYSLYGIT